MSKYKLEKKSVPLFACEVCGRRTPQSAAITIKSIKEFHRDGTIKIHYACSNHIVDLYKQITKEIENKSKISNKKI